MQTEEWTTSIHACTVVVETLWLYVDCNAAGWQASGRTGMFQNLVSFDSTDGQGLVSISAQVRGRG